MLNFCDFIQVYVFSTNHHLKEFEAAVVNKPSVFEPLKFYCSKCV